MCYPQQELFVTSIKLVFMKQVIISLVCFSLLNIACTPGNKISNTATSAEVEMAIESGQWVFSALRATSNAGRPRQLTTDYTVVLRGDTMISYLPYFGRAYSGGAGFETKSVLDFKSVDFKLSKGVNSKKATIITIKPGDYTDVQAYTFTFFSNGRADLNVVLTSRSPISFSGSVSPRKK